MLPIVAGVFAVVVIGVLILGFSRPSTFRVERSIVINASAHTIYELLTDFRQSERWSPWDKKDLNMKKTFGGSATGVGATFEWDGDNNVGHGRQEIVEAVPHSKVVTRLTFFRPFKGQNMAEFQLEPRNGSTNVRWIMYGPLHFIVRVLCFNMDKMIGKDFEQGLSNIKTVVESA